jgi:hypothetical protein
MSCNGLTATVKLGKLTVVLPLLFPSSLSGLTHISSLDLLREKSAQELRSSMPPMRM